MKHMLVTVAMVAALGACTDRRLIVESDTEWSGFIDEEESGYSRDGSGNARFDLDDGRVCWTFQKGTEQGSLRVYARTKELFGTETHGDARTTAVYGIVAGCVD